MSTGLTLLLGCLVDPQQGGLPAGANPWIQCQADSGKTVLHSAAQRNDAAVIHLVLNECRQQYLVAGSGSTSAR